MSKSIYEKLQVVAKSYTVLYVEDDADIQKVMCGILSVFCGTLYTAKNGQEGLELFYTLKPDLIITDISMPVMNGIEMVKTIRHSDKNIPIMVNSAFSDKEYLLDSIYIGVDRYTIKPIQHEEFLESLLFLFIKIKEKEQAKIYEQLKLQEKINKASTSMLASLIQTYPNPTVIYTQEGKVQFVNAPAVELFDLCLDDAENLGEAIRSMFIPKEGYVSDIFLIEENTMSKNRVLIRTKIAKKIYIVTKRMIRTQEFGKLFLYAFTDITRVEYEKQKSQNLSLYLREQLHYNLSTKSKLDACIQEKVPTKSLHVEQKNTPKSYEEIRLSAMHYVEKTSARQYASEVNADILEELAEMDELEHDMQESIILLEESFTLEVVHALAYDFLRYAKTIGRLVDFEDVAFSLEKLSEFLLSLSQIDFQTRKLHLLLDGISEDLKQWRKMIFISKEVQDIHYLDASLLSSCLQIEVEFGGKPIAQEDELDLF